MGTDGKTEDLGTRERGGVRETPIVRACVLLLAPGEWQKGDEALM